MQLPLAYLDATVVEEVPVALWQQLFDAIGWPPSLDRERAALTHASVLDAFDHDPPSDELLQALEALDTLGTEAGGEAIMGALQDQRLSPNVLAPGGSARELALQLYLAQRTDAAMANVFSRAQSAAQERGEARHFHEFLGREARRISGLDQRRVALESATRQYASEQDLGDHVHVRAFDDDGTLTFYVIRSHRTQKPLAIVPGRAARAMIAYRPVHSDLLRYDTTTGRLRIAARASSVVPFFRRTLGEVLFGDTDFFSSDAVCSLKVLQEQGARALERHEIAGIGRVRMTECMWERGDRGLVQVRAADCFREIAELRLPLSEGELLQAKLKVQVIGPSTRPVTVTIRVPSRIEVSQQRHQPLIDRLLTQIGIRQRRPPAAQPDLWTLYPWRHPRATWQTLFGRDADALMERGVLRSVPLEAVPHPDAPGAGRVLRAIQASEGELYGVSTEPDIPSRSLTTTDIDGWMLEPERFRQELRSRFGVLGTARPWSEHDTLLDLGDLDLDGTRLHLVYALRPPSPGAGERLRQLAGVAPHALLVPGAMYESTELPIALLDGPLPTRSDVVRAAVAAAGLTEHVSALHIAGDGARLVVDTRQQTVWMDGVLVAGLTPDTHPYKFVVRMARSTEPVSHDELREELSSARRDDGVPARQAKLGACNALRQALTQAGKTLDIEDPFPSAGRGFYRCVLPCHVR